MRSTTGRPIRFANSSANVHMSMFVNDTHFGSVQIWSRA